MVTAVEYAMEAPGGNQLTPEERFEVFGDFDPDAHAEEAEERWGGTDAYHESARRTASYTKDDWERMKVEGAEINDRLVAALHAGRPADGPRRWTPPRSTASRSAAGSTSARRRCTSGSARCTSPTRASRRHYEDVAPGLATYLRDAIVANAARRAEG